jgi:hypothetical protein
MKKKMGRPKLPSGQSKDVQVGVRFNPKDAKKIQRAIDQSSSDRTQAEWIRNAAVTVAEQWERPSLASDIFWGQLPYPAEEMDEKTIEFEALIKWPEYKQPTLTSGTGKMFVRERPGGFHVRIISTISREREKVIDLTDAQAKLIKRQPEGSKYAFSLVATASPSSK